MNALRACVYTNLRLAAQLSWGAHVVVYQSDCRYLPYTKHENT